jgi:hypothetical protein
MMFDVVLQGFQGPADCHIFDDACLWMKSFEALILFELYLYHRLYHIFLKFLNNASETSTRPKVVKMGAYSLGV